MVRKDSNRTNNKHQKVKKTINKQKNKKEKEIKPQQIQEHFGSQEIEIDGQVDQGQQELEKQSQQLRGIIKYQKNYELKAVYSQYTIEYSNNYMFIFGISDGVLNIFNREFNRITQKIEHKDEEIVCFGINQLENLMVTFTNDYQLRILELQYQGGKYEVNLVKQMHLANFYIKNIKIHQSLMTIYNESNMIRVYNLRKQQLLNQFNNHSDCTAMLIHNQQVIVGSEDSCIRIYDIVMNRIMKTIRYKEKAEIKQIMSWRSNMLIIVFEDGVLIVLDLVSEEKERISLGIQINSVEKYQDWLIVGGNDGVVNVVGFGKLINQYKVQERQDIELNQGVSKININTKTNVMYILTDEQNVLQFNISQQKDGLVIHQSHYCNVLFNDEIVDLKYNDYKQIVIASNSKIIKLYDRQNQFYQLVHGNSNIVLCCDCKNEYMVTGNKDNRICLFKRTESNESYELVQVYEGHSEDVTSVVLSYDLKHIYSSGNDQTVKQWVVKDDKQVQKMALRSVMAHSKDINQVVIAPNDKYVASCSQDKKVKVFKADLQIKMELKGHRRAVYAIDFNPYEQTICSSSADNTIKLFNLVDGECMMTLQTQSAVIKIKFINYGLQLVAGTVDGLFQIWNLNKQVMVNIYDIHVGKVWAIDIINNGQQVCTGANDSTFYILKDVSQQFQEQEMQQQQNMVQNQMNFRNLVRNKEYLEAIRLAFQNNYVQGFRDSLTSYLSCRDDKTDENMGQLVTEFVSQDFNRLVIIIRDLNIVPKYCHLAQTLLKALFVKQSLTQLIKLGKSFRFEKKDKKEEDELEVIMFEKNRQSNDFEKLVEMLESCCKKHKDRLQKYIKETCFIEYALQRLDNLMPVDPSSI